MLEALGLSRSTYYYEISKKDKVQERNSELSAEISSVFAENKGRYGVRRVHQALLSRGHQVNHKRVQRIMHQLGLLGKRPKEKYHSYKGEVGKVAANIINRDFSTKRPLQKWTTDVSQFNLSWGKCYLSPILDMNTNEIISYNLSLSPNLEQIKDMLAKAFQRFPSVQGLIMHSDQGWQYQHEFYRNELANHGVIQSMSRKGNCYDNCIMETFFGRLKNEMFYGFEKEYPSFEAFQNTIAEYIDYYNNRRIQAKTKWMPPSKFREASMMECQLFNSMKVSSKLGTYPCRRHFSVLPNQQQQSDNQSKSHCIYQRNEQCCPQCAEHIDPAILGIPLLLGVSGFLLLHGRLFSAAFSGHEHGWAADLGHIRDGAAIVIVIDLIPSCH